MRDVRRTFPAITLDIIAVRRFISLAKREADSAIALERPQRGPYLCTKLLDYSLKLYGTNDYLARSPAIQGISDLAAHTFIGYVEELLFSDRLRYLEDVVSTDRVIFKSTSVIAQYHARSEEHTSELQSLMRISYAVFCLKKKKKTPQP